MLPAVVVDIVAGFHVPVILLFEVRGKVAGVAPTQYGPNAVNVGVIFELMVMLIVLVEAHCPVVGVKV